MDELLISEEILTELKISRSTLSRLVASGEIKALRITENGALRFKRAEVQAVLVPRSVPASRAPVTRAQLPGRGMMKFG